MTERLIVDSILRLLRKRGAWAVKTHGSPMLAGLPDIFVCYRGRFLGLEVKQPRTANDASARQLAILKQINKAGGFGRIVVSAEEVALLLDRIDLELA